MQSVITRSTSVMNSGVNTKTWIGLQRESSSGEFVWADGSSLVYTNWGTGEPGSHNCVALYYDVSSDDLRWKTTECENDEEVAGNICQTRVQCSAGMYSITASQCALCEHGSYSAFESTFCTLCWASRYSLHNNQALAGMRLRGAPGECRCCVGCPAGTASPWMSYSHSATILS